MEIHKTKGFKVGMTIGIIGVVLSIPLTLLVLPLSRIMPDFILSIYGPIAAVFGIIGLILTITGAFGCDLKNDNCQMEMIIGYIITILVCALLGWAVDAVYRKIKRT